MTTVRHILIALVAVAASCGLTALATPSTVWASTAPQMAAPDGIAADPEGGIWVATALQPKVIRYAEGGEVTGEVETSQIAYAVALGGSDGRTLFAMTAPSSEPSVVDGQSLGKIEIATV